MSYDASAARRATVEVRNNPVAASASAPSATAKAGTPQAATQTSAPTRPPAAGSPASSGTPTESRSPLETDAWPILPGGRPDFARMTAAQRNLYDAWRLKRRYG
jgi:hypothetical protein